METKEVIYTVKNRGDQEYSIHTQDGGLAWVHSNGEQLLLTLYQNRANDNPDEGKQYTKEFPLDTERSIIVDEALNWLVVSINHKIKFKHVK